SSSAAHDPAALNGSKAARSPTIYIQDFSAQTQQGDQNQGLRSMIRGLRSGISQQQLVGKLSGAVADDLRARGYTAERIPASASLPSRGMLARGTSVAVGETGSESMIDADFGKRPVELYVTVDDLVAGEPRPLFAVSSQGSASGLGLPPIPNPYAAAAKF